MFDFTENEIKTIIDAVSSEAENVSELLRYGLVPEWAEADELHNAIVLEGTVDELRRNGNYARLSEQMIVAIVDALTYNIHNSEELGLYDEADEYEAALTKIINAPANA